MKFFKHEYQKKHKNIKKFFPDEKHNRFLKIKDSFEKLEKEGYLKGHKLIFAENNMKIDPDLFSTYSRLIFKAISKIEPGEHQLNELIIKLLASFSFAKNNGLFSKAAASKKVDCLFSSIFLADIFSLYSFSTNILLANKHVLLNIEQSIYDINKPRGYLIYPAKRLSEFYPAFFNVNVESLALFNLALKHYNKKDYKKALESIDIAIEFDNIPYYYELKGAILEMLGKREEAVYNYLFALDKDPSLYTTAMRLYMLDLYNFISFSKSVEEYLIYMLRRDNAEHIQELISQLSIALPSEKINKLFEYILTEPKH